MVPINYLAVLVCGILAMALGMLWYGPLFGKAWMQLAGMSEADMVRGKTDPAKKRQMYWGYLIPVIFALIAAFVLGHALIFAEAYLGWGVIIAVLEVGALNWLGFTAPPTIGMVLWEGKPWKYWWIVAGYWLVFFCISGALLAVWI